MTLCRGGPHLGPWHLLRTAHAKNQATLADQRGLVHQTYQMLRATHCNATSWHTPPGKTGE